MEVGEQVDHIFIIPNQKACSHKINFFYDMGSYLSEVF